jgi:hypothetical protein
LTGETTLKQTLAEEYMLSIKKARRQNAIEHPPQPIPADEWFLSR